MTLPGLALGTLIGALIGTLLHLVVGGHIGRLILYLLFGVAGFWAGQILAEISGWTFISIGVLHLGLAIPVCLAVSGAGYWLSLVQTVKRE
jgi:H+/Cl- antiporter ClcA